MTVGLNVTEACAASHGCFLLLLCPEPLWRKEESTLPSVPSALMQPRSWKIYCLTPTSIRQLQFLQTLRASVRS